MKTIKNKNTTALRPGVLFGPIFGSIYGKPLGWQTFFEFFLKLTRYNANKGRDGGNA